MDVILFTQDDPIYMPRYLEPVFAERSEALSKVVLAPMQRSALEEVRGRFQMFGPSAFFRFGLRYAAGKIAARLPTGPVYRTTGRFHSVRSLAAAYDVPVEEVNNVNDEAFVSEVRELQPDLILSIACGQRMGEDLLEIPKDGAINVHGSLLPKYRGLSTSFWVLYHGEDENGVTAHYMTPEFDSGDIIVQRKYEVRPSDTMHDVYLKLTEVGPTVAVDVIDQVADGTIETRPNNLEEGEYYSFPTRDDRREFRRRGNRFI
ncbi:methionyl-tRNA formyltransferase [Saliphagus sp. GCM10025334]